MKPKYLHSDRINAIKNTINNQLAILVKNMFALDSIIDTNLSWKTTMLECSIIYSLA